MVAPSTSTSWLIPGSASGPRRDSAPSRPASSPRATKQVSPSRRSRRLSGSTFSGDPVMWHRPSLMLVGFLVAMVFSSTGCQRHAASGAECAAVLDRLVELELNESGYRDPVLRARWQQDLGQRFAPEVARCRGLSVRDDLGKCLAAARSPEEITHRCLQ